MTNPNKADIHVGCGLFLLPILLCISAGLGIVAFAWIVKLLGP